MRILVNASNIKLSGLLQVTVSFLNEIIAMEKYKFVVVASTPVLAEIEDLNFGDNIEIIHLDFKLPFHRGYFSSIEKLESICQIHKVDCIFSVFGPTYWRPSLPHIAGFAYGWAINPDSLFIRKLPFLRKLKMLLENQFKSYYFRNDACQYIVETQVVRNRLNKYIGVPLDSIFVVSNTYNHFFDKALDVAKRWEIPKDGFRLLTISSNYDHKNLAVFKKVSNYFRQQGIRDIYFVVTVPDEDFTKLFGSDCPNVVNVGKVSPKDCPSLYLETDAMILPTFLESFSACYPEAMVMRKPIMTSDLDFARDICRNAALYFDPFDYKDVAEKILTMRDSPDLRKDLIEKGLLRVKDFSSAKERAEEYVRICTQIVSLNEDYIT